MKKVFYLLVLILGFFCSNESSVLNNSAVVHALQETEFCGNKHKNLVILKTVLAGQPCVAVPAFTGVTSARIEHFLKMHAPSFITSYQQAIDLLNKTPLSDGSSQSLKDAQEQLSLVQQQIIRCFAEQTFSFSSDEKKFFDDVARKNQMFMVRSTGIEDGAVANAGGNVSIAYVKPTAQAIQAAMGEVVASYFGFHSLKSRIASGEALSANDLCLPVLIQSLVGERLDGADDRASIPVSGVAYTTNQSLSSESFKIMEINAAYGHGEGVVANRVVSDRYYIAPSKVHPDGICIYSALYEKNDRLVPHQEAVCGDTVHTLIYHKNNAAMACQSALSQDMLGKLYTVLSVIEKSYGQPMDVEFVVLDSMIYLVQARPAMYVPMNPTYLDIEQCAANITVNMPSTPIVQGKAEALIITDPHDILVCKTLDDADQMPNSTQVKAVIVTTMASSLSHAAVNFKTYGIPCLFVHDMAKIISLQGAISSQKPLVIDIQNNAIMQFAGSRDTVRAHIKRGWLEHPIAGSLSLWQERMQLPQKIYSSLPRNHELYALLDVLKKARGISKQQEAIQKLVKCLTKHIELLSQRMQFLAGFCNAEITQSFKVYKELLDNLLKDMGHSINQGCDLFEFLFYVKMVEVLMHKNGENIPLLAGYTYEYFLNTLNKLEPAVMVAIKAGKKSSEFADFL